MYEIVVDHKRRPRLTAKRLSQICQHSSQHVLGKRIEQVQHHRLAGKLELACICRVCDSIAKHCCRSL